MRKCVQCGSTSRVTSYKGTVEVCQRHRAHLRLYGRILVRTVRDKNEVFDRGDYYEMALYDRRHNIIGFTQFDKEDLAIVKKHKWSLSDTGYVRSGSLRLHRLIMKCPLGMEVDHIDHIPGNNRRSNLRICTHKQNRYNSSKQSISTQLYKGIERRSNHWKVRLRKGGQRYWCGSFDDAHIAALMHDFWAVELYGEFATTNFKVVAHG